MKLAPRLVASASFTSVSPGGRAVGYVVVEVPAEIAATLEAVPLTPPLNCEADIDCYCDALARDIEHVRAHAKVSLEQLKIPRIVAAPLQMPGPIERK